ncbi:methionine aminopeptidase 1-like [Centruroides sculpturatus]|uniref:methionine aminopeptidase 1-like n=1 Tax=Centruroides sculpturatus TaxID=218467 RepID=UPI000C6E5F4B|nr:methionine aminopeptidase 1-like [Centruroides sculpturatus]
MSVCTEEKFCETPKCENTARLRCPTCIKLGIEGSYFCSQECFKGNWDVHKLLHRKAKNIQQVSNESIYNPWPWYEFTGKLRPFQVVRHPLSEQAVKGSTHIKVLDDEEIEGLKVACKLAREVLDVAANAVAVGVTTDEIDRLVHEACIEKECYPSPLNYYGFPKSCCTNLKNILILQFISVDITVYHRGFHGDLNETFFVGNVDEESKKLVKVTHECLTKAIEIVKPGVKYREIGNVIQKHAQAHGFSVVRSFCGHGIHRLFHTAPSVPHYAIDITVYHRGFHGDLNETFFVGNVDEESKKLVKFEVYCMICNLLSLLGTWREVVWPDNWTAVTQDGKRSAQFEQTLLVTDTGCEILTRRRDKNGQPYFMDN